MKNLVRYIKRFFYQEPFITNDENGSNIAADEICFHCYAEEPYVYFLKELCK